MKIIGKAKGSFIIEAGFGEVANLIGYYALYDIKPQLEVGDEIQISKMYHQLNKLAEREREIKLVIETLRQTADILAPVPPVLNYITNEIKEV